MYEKVPCRLLTTFAVDSFEGCPVFFLTRFSLEEQRRIRNALRDSTNSVEGSSFCYFGYLWPENDTTTHSVQDLRDLFESCDPLSPAFHPRSPGPYHLDDYPSLFIAVDERCLDPENRKVLMFHTFRSEDSNDKLGWEYGLVPAGDALINFVCLEIGKLSPDEVFMDMKLLWMSDLREHAAEYLAKHNQNRRT